jgi:hypothetical protein
MNEARRYRLASCGAISGAVLGSVVLNGLAVRAVGLNPPGGTGMTQKWFDTCAGILGVPLSLLFQVLMPRADRWLVALTLVLNFAMWGAVCGLLLHRVFSRRQQ